MPDNSERRAASDERFTFRQFHPGDEKAILDLFARSFPHASRTLEHFVWKYERDPFGKWRISLAFDEAGRLVGQYAGYPVPLYAHGETVLIQHIGDTMTDPSIRHVGRGPTSILGRTVSHFYESFCEGKIAYNYGFNVGNIQKFSTRFLKIEWVEPVPYRALPHVEPIKLWHRWARGYQIEVLRSATPEIDALFARTAPHYHFLTRRDAQYLQWRYLDSPDVPYLVVAIRRWRRLVGWSVFRIRDGRMSWGDALFDPRHPAAIGILLRQVAGGREVDCWFPSRPRWFDQALRGLGFESRPEPQDLSMVASPFIMSDAIDRLRENLYYTMGDSDLF